MDDLQQQHDITPEILAEDFAGGAKPELGGDLTQQDRQYGRQDPAGEPSRITLPDAHGDDLDDVASSNDAAFAQIETECGLVSSAPRWDAHPAYTDLSD